MNLWPLMVTYSSVAVASLDSLVVVPVASLDSLIVASLVEVLVSETFCFRSRANPSGSVWKHGESSAFIRRQELS